MLPLLPRMRGEAGRRADEGPRVGHERNATHHYSSQSTQHATINPVTTPPPLASGATLAQRVRG